MASYTQANYDAAAINTDIYSLVATAEDIRLKAKRNVVLDSVDGFIDASSNRIKNLANATDIQDAATLADVHTVAMQSTGRFSACRAVIVDNVANFASVDLTNVDGLALSVGDRVLVVNQTNQVENGVYIVATAGATGALVRPTDLPAGNQIYAYATVTILEGNAFGDTQWQIPTSVSLPATIGTDALVFIMLVLKPFDNNVIRGPATVLSENHIAITAVPGQVGFYTMANQPIDSYNSLIVGDVILLMNQNLSWQNGLYTITSLAGGITVRRHPEVSSMNHIATPFMVSVTNGNEYMYTIWQYIPQGNFAETYKGDPGHADSITKKIEQVATAPTITFTRMTVGPHSIIAGVGHYYNAAHELCVGFTSGSILDFAYGGPTPNKHVIYHGTPSNGITSRANLRFADPRGFTFVVGDETGVYYNGLQVTDEFATNVNGGSDIVRLRSGASVGLRNAKFFSRHYNKIAPATAAGTGFTSLPTNGLASSLIYNMAPNSVVTLAGTLFVTTSVTSSTSLAATLTVPFVLTLKSDASKLTWAAARNGIVNVNGSVKLVDVLNDATTSTNVQLDGVALSSSGITPVSSSLVANVNFRLQNFAATGADTFHVTSILEYVVVDTATVEVLN